MWLLGCLCDLYNYGNLEIRELVRSVSATVQLSLNKNASPYINIKIREVELWNTF